MKNRIIILFTFIFSICITSIYAQKNELKEKCQIFAQMKMGTKALNIKYTIMADSGNGDEGSKAVAVEYATDGKGQRRFKLGDLQTIIEIPGKSLQVVYPAETLILKIDSTFKTNVQSGNISDIIEGYIDSSKVITKTNDGEGIHYWLNFNTGSNSAIAKLSFQKDGFTPKFLGMYNGSDLQKAKLLMAIQFDYWIADWKPNTGFPNIEEYITHNDGVYVVTPAYNTYKLMVYENGRYRY